MSQIRFLLGEHLSIVIANALRYAGVDVVTATEAGLYGQTDHAVLQGAIADQRVIVTNDEDFLRLAHESPDHAGIIFCTSSRNIAQIVTELLLAFETFDADAIHGTIHYIRPDHR